MSVGYRMGADPGAGEVVVTGGGYENLERQMKKPDVSKCKCKLSSHVQTRTI